MGCWLVACLDAITYTPRGDTSRLLLTSILIGPDAQPPITTTVSKRTARMRIPDTGFLPCCSRPLGRGERRVPTASRPALGWIQFVRWCCSQSWLHRFHRIHHLFSLSNSKAFLHLGRAVPRPLRFGVHPTKHPGERAMFLNW